MMNHSLGYVYAAMAAMFWAVSGSSAKFLFHQGVTPFQLVQLRITIATVVVFFGMLICNRKLPKIARKDIAYFVILGSLGLASVQFTYLFTISKIHVAAAILLQYFAPVIIAVYSITFGKEKLTPSMLMSLTGGTLGCYLAVGAYNLNMLNMNMIGIFSGILAAIAFAWYSIQGEYGMKPMIPGQYCFCPVFCRDIVEYLLSAIQRVHASVFAGGMGLDFIYCYFRNSRAIRAVFQRHQADTRHKSQHHRNS
ncbi:MAG: DMT family transporter [Desulfobacteraceae bacterium]|nr:DMT family transporter [Desulfobacteraceae bacterium]